MARPMTALEILANSEAHMATIEEQFKSKKDKLLKKYDNDFVQRNNTYLDYLRQMQDRLNANTSPETVKLIREEIEQEKNKLDSALNSLHKKYISDREKEIKKHERSIANYKRKYIEALKSEDKLGVIVEMETKIKDLGLIINCFRREAKK